MSKTDKPVIREVDRKPWEPYMIVSDRLPAELIPARGEIWAFYAATTTHIIMSLIRKTRK